MTNRKREYLDLNCQIFHSGSYCIVPIRDQDKYPIMDMRNSQIFHLRQSKLLTRDEQDNYFSTVINNLFDKEKPTEILFSYLKDDELIGYGGLVHLNWTDKNAEISFIIKENYEKELEKHWTHFLEMISQVAFQQLELHKIFTYAFDLRPYLYKILEKNSFNKDATLTEHCLFDGKYLDVVIHSKFRNAQF